MRLDIEQFDRTQRRIICQLDQLFQALAGQMHEIRYNGQDGVARPTEFRCLFPFISILRSALRSIVNKTTEQKSMTGF